MNNLVLGISIRQKDLLTQALYSLFEHGYDGGSLFFFFFFGGG